MLCIRVQSYHFLSSSKTHFTCVCLAPHSGSACWDAFLHTTVVKSSDLTDRSLPVSSNWCGCPPLTFFINEAMIFRLQNSDIHLDSVLRENTSRSALSETFNLTPTTMSQIKILFSTILMVDVKFKQSSRGFYALRCCYMMIDWLDNCMTEQGSGCS